MKKYHFVYKTICLLTNHYYIGVHSTDNINDGYLGSGIKFRNYLKKYKPENFSRTIIHFFDTRDDAFRYEKDIVNESVLLDNMCLNVSQGGIGYKHKYNETFKDRISATRKNRIDTGVLIPTKHTEEHKQKMRDYNPGGEATAKPIYQIDADTGEVIKLWKSMRQAGMELNIKSWRNISTAINKHKFQTVGGFFWRWSNDSDVIDNKLTNIEELNTIRLDSGTRSGKQVQQLDDQWNVVKEWKNMCEAGRAYGLSNSTISTAIKANRKCAGFYWKKV